MKTERDIREKLEETLRTIREPRGITPELIRANLDYAKGLAFVLDVRIDYEKMEIAKSEIGEAQQLTTTYQEHDFGRNRLFAEIKRDNFTSIGTEEKIKNLWNKPTKKDRKRAW